MNRRELVKTLAVLPAAAALPFDTEASEGWQTGPPEQSGQFLVTSDTFNPFMGGVMKPWKAAQPVDSVWVHCRGGGAFEGMWLANEIQKAGIPVYVAGLAAGVAALLPIYSPHGSIHPHGFLNLMNCWMEVRGSEAMRRAAEQLEKIDLSIALGISQACARRGHDLSTPQISEWMSENTWFNAQKALEAGLISEISDTPPPRVFREDTRHSAG